MVLGTESWLDNTIMDSEIFPSTYTTYRKDRSVHGGGVFVLIHNSLSSLSVNIECNTCETVWCKVMLQDGSSVAFGSFYRPPGANTAQPLLQLSNILLSLEATYTILAGDFNLPNVEWVSFQPIIQTTSLLYSAFRDMINAHSLLQFVETPTRLGPTSANVLDLFLCSDRNIVSSVLTIPGISDHEVVVAKMCCNATRRRSSQPRKVFFYESGDYGSLSSELDEFFPEFQLHTSALDINSAWNLFKTKILSLTQTFVPSRIILAKRRNDKPWMNRELRTLISKKNRLFRRYCQSRETVFYLKMKEMNRNIAKEMRKAQNKYERTLSEKVKRNPKEVWKYVKNKKNSNITIPDVVDGIDYSNDREGKAESFNLYFQSVFTQPGSMVDSLRNFNGFSLMDDIEFSEHGITLLLQKIKVGSAPGPDRISNYILKNCAPSVASYLIVLFRKSFEQSELPLDWKNANVVPVHKSGDKTKTSNYRPISLTSVSCKTLEHIIYTNLISHLQGNNFFHPTQHGFRTGYSCDTQLVEFTHDIATSINHGSQVDCVFLDFRKAFDSVSHTLLLQKLSTIHIPNTLLKWLEAYLVGRKQNVVLDGLNSSYVSVLSGVPQGSVLGPLLFLIYINDLAVNISSSVRLYADDCCVYRDITCEADSELLQNDLSSILSWCQTWQMTLNLNKCNLVRFTNKRRPLLTEYFLGGTSLSVVLQYKYLGVLFSSELSWNSHVNYLSSKASRTLNFLKRNFRQAPAKLKETLYMANVRPILEYACTAWDLYTKTSIDELERIQKRAARFVTGDYDFSKSSSAMCTKLGWPSLADRRKYLRLSLFYNTFNNRNGINKEQYIKEPTYVSPRTDHPLKVHEYRCRINIFKYSFFPRTVHDWNNLPAEIVSAPCFSFFTTLQNFLLN